MKKNQIAILWLVGISVVYLACQQATEAQELFSNQCATCHYGNGTTSAPSVVHLSAMTPRSIVSSLESGKMQIQGKLLSRDQKIGIAEMLTLRKYSENKPPLNLCDSDDLQLSNVRYFGWGGDKEGTGYIKASVAKLSQKQVSRLKLKWAFGFDGGTVTRSKPTVIDESIIFGSQYGEVYCLDMISGCVQWMFQADAVVRGGIAVSQNTDGDISVYFADFNCITYCLNANTGKLNWKSEVKSESINAVTGTVVYSDGIVYIPLTSMEVIVGNQPSYECCKGSGMVVAVNAENGEEVWRHRVISELATEQKVGSDGVKKFGPSGAPVWSSPTVDEKRGLLYIGTGENNSYPTTTSSDALQALDLKTGKLIWNYQATSGDAYVQGEFNRQGTSMKPCAHCPDPAGPDPDFGMAPVLAKRMDNSEVLIVGQKSGLVHCLDPKTGEPLWQTRIGRGGALGGIHWGIATDGKVAYVSNSDWFPFGSDSSYPASPGLYALDMMTGDVIWKSTADPSICKGIQGCYSAYSAAPTLIDGAVFTGNLDGYARAHDAQTG